MNLVKRNRNQFFPSVMEEFFRPDWVARNENYSGLTVPPVNIRETEMTYEVELAAPGKKKDDFNIEIDNDLLTISSETRTEQQNTEGKFTRREFSHSSFRRAFTLPETINAEDIKASYNDGILSISLPKREDTLPKPKRSIEIG